MKSMFKKVLLCVLFVGLIAVLVVGAINRTISKNGDTAQAAGRGHNQSQATAGVKSNQRDGSHQVAGDRTAGSGRRAVENDGQYRNYQEAAEEWITYEGIANQVPAAGVELVLETGDGELVIGTGPVALVDLGMAVQVGDSLEVTGYWENDEFKAAEIAVVSSGQKVVLRDSWGRPVWSGSARSNRSLEDGALSN
jgi:hypothetical protein